MTRANFHFEDDHKLTSSKINNEELHPPHHQGQIPYSASQTLIQKLKSELFHNGSYNLTILYKDHL